MNRSDRRAQRAAAKKAAVPRIVAVHEAGHAVGRYLTAGLMGIPEDRAIHNIVTEVRPLDMPKRISVDSGYQLTAGATTYGPMFSAEIDVIWKRIDPETEPENKGSRDYMERVMAVARNCGADIESWLLAKCVIAVSGPIAEAAASGRNFQEVWDSPECEGDMRSLIHDCTLAGVDEPEDMQKQEDAACKWMLEQMKRQEVCDAINAVTARIQKPGKMPGATVAKIIRRAIDGGTVNSGPRAV